MGTKFTYALMISLAGAVLHLLLYFTGFQTEKLAAGQHFGWLGIIIMIVLLVLGIRAVREEAPDRSLSYGKGVGTGVVISLISGVLSGIYTFIHFRFINTEFADYQMEIVRAQWEAAGMGAAQIEQVEGVTRAMMSPVAQATMTPISAVITGLIISLIASAILKRAPQPPAPPPV